MNSNVKKTNTVVVCAVLAAVVVALNFIASLHMVRLDAVFYLAGGSLVYFAVRLFGTGPGAALYVAASVLSFAIVPDKVWLLLFVGVFGPAAILQTAFEKRLKNSISAVLTIAVFVILFYLFGFVIVYGNGFVPHIGLPATVLPVQIITLCFAAFSAVIACIVNRGLYFMLMYRLRGLYGADTEGSKKIYTGSPKAANQPATFNIPKLSDEAEDEENNNGGKNETG